jgi:hypothetical protein
MVQMLFVKVFPFETPFAVSSKVVKHPQTQANKPFPRNNALQARTATFSAIPILK